MPALMQTKLNVGILLDIHALQVAFIYLSGIHQASRDYGTRNKTREYISIEKTKFIASLLYLYNDNKVGEHSAHDLQTKCNLNIQRIKLFPRGNNAVNFPNLNIPLRKIPRIGRKRESRAK